MAPRTFRPSRRSPSALRPYWICTSRKQTARLPPEPAFSILQEPRSLLITYGAAYTQYLHGIAERDVDTPADLARVCNVDRLGDAALRQAIERAQTTSTSVPRARRVSLTFRDVERVAPSLRLR